MAVDDDAAAACFEVVPRTAKKWKRSERSAAKKRRPEETAPRSEQTTLQGVNRCKNTVDMTNLKPSLIIGRWGSLGVAFGMNRESRPSSCRVRHRVSDLTCSTLLYRTAPSASDRAHRLFPMESWTGVTAGFSRSILSTRRPGGRGADRRRSSSQSDPGNGWGSE